MNFSQLEINFPPASHSHDPISSFDAEYEITQSGIRGEQMNAIYKLVMLNPGRTSKELAELSKYDRYQIARRLSDLENIFRVKKGETRTCIVGGRKSVTWWIS